MNIKFNIPKDKIDEALRDEINRLKKENAKLERQLSAALAKSAATQTHKSEIEKMYFDFKALCDKWADHDGCHD